MSAVLRVRPLGSRWETDDPFLFCVHHDDAYPPGDGTLAPAASLAGREIGADFSGKDGWSMYHGDRVPGFPAHPHRGFETVTIVRRGRIDHSDSLGATARFGGGDVQWLTAGRGIVHAEMFPLLKEDGTNRLELFQIWLNLPAARKMAAPHFTMFWNEQLPRRTLVDAAGRRTDVVVVAGTFGDTAPLAPPPDSWAARADSGVAIWTLRADPGARFSLPPAPADVVRTLYFFAGPSARIGGEELPVSRAVTLDPRAEVEVVAGAGECEFLLLQGRPIGEPVAQYGPFVMNQPAEIAQAIADYRRTQFGGWPFPSADPVHPAAQGRFARYPDGRTEAPPA